MPSISVQDLLDEVEAVIAEEYPDNPEALDEGVALAEDFLYGTRDVAGVAKSSVVTVDDYVQFAESICNDASTTEFYYGSASDEDLFFEVRDVLDEILQDEFQGYNSSAYTRWGECPAVSGNQNVTALPYFFGNATLSSDVFGSAGRSTVATSEKPKTAKKTKPTAAMASSVAAATAAVGASASQSASRNAASTQAPILSGRAYCDALAKEIQPGGANLIVVGVGFACEYNYNPNRRYDVVEIGYHGEDVSPSVYRYYPKAPESSKLPSTPPAQATSAATSSAPTTVATSTAPTPKPKSLDDLFRMYQGGASQQEIERIMQYKGDVPWDVDDPDGINDADFVSK